MSGNNKLYLVYVEIKGTLASTPFFKCTTKKMLDEFLYKEPTGLFEQIFLVMSNAKTKQKIHIKKFSDGFDVYVGTRSNEPQFKVVVRQVVKKDKREKSGPCSKALEVDQAINDWMLKFVTVDEWAEIIGGALQ